VARGGIGQADLTEGARRRALRALLALTFFTWGGFYLVVPLISVRYVEQLGWAAASIGVVLAARQFTQQGLTVVSGVVADRFGAKRLIAAGMLLRAVGFGAMAFASTYPLLLVAAVVAAIGGGLFDSPKSATIAAIARPDERAHFYAQAGVAAGLGMTVGMQAGALLMRADFAAVTLVGGAIYLLMAGVVVVLIPAVRVADGQASPLHGIRLALRDRRFLTYISLMSGQWFMSTQFLITLPLAATAIAGTPDAVAWVFGVNSRIESCRRPARSSSGSRRRRSASSAWPSLAARRRCFWRRSSFRAGRCWCGRTSKRSRPNSPTRSPSAPTSGSPRSRSPSAAASATSPAASSTISGRAPTIRRCPGPFARWSA
jgi:MFS family permease